MIKTRQAVAADKEGSGHHQIADEVREAITGRPSKYTEKIGDTICERLMDGESLRVICASSNLPSRHSVFRWLASDERFRDQYARAREIQAEVLADEMIAIADDASNDVTGELGVPNSVAVHRAKLQIETRKWIACKLLPRKYGDKLDMNLSGKDGGPIQAAIAVTFVRTNGITSN
jgi:hypothetical protein